MKKQPFSFIEYIGEKIYLIVFLAAIGGGLIASVLMLNNIMNKSTLNSGAGNTSKVTSFDQSAINEVNKLMKSSENATLIDKSSRTNPFSE